LLGLAVLIIGAEHADERAALLAIDLGIGRDAEVDLALAQVVSSSTGR